MARGGAPSQRGRIERRGPDVTIHAPAAIWPPSKPLFEAKDLTPQDLIMMQANEIRELKHEVEMQKLAAHTITRYCICCMHVIMVHTGEDVVAVDRELYEKFKGAEIQIAEWQDGNAGPVFGRFLEKAPDIIIGG